jgi:oxygen-independent coproporphyrinogen III oxidase
VTSNKGNIWEFTFAIYWTCVILFVMQSHSLYLHIPFCKQRCAYCDFNTYAGMESLIPEYTRALCREMDLVAGSAVERIPVHTIFFGGGTPSLLPGAQLADLLKTAGRNFDILPEAEITLEANPGTVTADSLKAMHDLGINRISLGMQSASPEELRLLTRVHDLKDVIQAVAWAHQAGFHNLSVDLIFGLPHQTLQTWKNTVEMALQLDTQHISLYSLTVEQGTPLARWTAHGLVNMPDDDLAADMYEWSMERLSEAGFVQYEISNWARYDSAGKLLASRHNLQYWYNLPYLGLGAGAHGYTAGKRTANVGPIKTYIERISKGSVAAFPDSPANQRVTEIDRESEMGETMMVGLRLTQEGVVDEEFTDRFGQTLETVFGEPISRLTRNGLLEWVEDDRMRHRLRLTPHGRLLGNRVFMEFI